MTATPRIGIAARLARIAAGSGCLGCGGASGTARLLCRGCELRLSRARPLRGGPPPGVDRAVAAYEHAGVARELVAALKFRRRLAAAELMAERLAPLLDQTSGSETAESRSAATSISHFPPLVPVPSAPWRQRRRGFNPAAELAKSLSRQLTVGIVDCLRRRGEAHQLGRSRGSRRAPDFVIEVAGVAPPRCLLVDDVFTTGGTLTACAVALRRAGTREITAVTFTRRP